MKRFLHSRSLPCNLLAAAFLTFGIGHAHASAGAQNADEGNEAKNLARMNCGAQIECVTPDGRVLEVPTANEQNRGAAALIMDDDTLSCPLQEGQTTFVIKLPATSLLDRFTFVNENAAAAGQLKISVSNYQLPAASNKWIEVDGQIAFAHKRLFNLSMLGVEARYVKLAFHVEKAGRIAALGLYGGQSLESFARRNLHVIHDGTGGRLSDSEGIRVSNPGARAALADSLNFDFANVYAKARVVYVSSGAMASARRMIDDDTITSYKFAPADTRPTTIVELAQNERLHRVSALYKMQAGRMDVYLLNELRADPGDLRNAKLIASITDADRKGKAAVNFDPQGARYVALRWTPSEENAGEPFEVAEINAFGNVPLSMVNFTAMPDTFASNMVSAPAPTLPAEIPTLPDVALVSP
ncbi:MAG: hypothetical protein M3Y86_06845 [Verrucomicrobiota bacterium]|nr:hypothetical protein [Verrucomicrobiota bacterium]